MSKSDEKSKGVILKNPKNGDIFFKMDGKWVEFRKSMALETIAKEIVKMILAKTNGSEVNFTDFGGVAEHFLGGRGDQPYISNPPKVIKQGVVGFSYVPASKNFMNKEK